MGKALDRVIDLLDLEQIEVNIFRGRSPEERVQRVFGGQVAEQADPMPDVPPPDAVERNSDRLARLLGQVPPQVRESPIDLRSISPMSAEAARDPSLRTTRNLIWLRADGDLPDDPLLHVCLMT